MASRIYLFNHDRCLLTNVDYPYHEYGSYNFFDQLFSYKMVYANRKCILLELTVGPRSLSAGLFTHF